MLSSIGFQLDCEGHCRCLLLCLPDAESKLKMLGLSPCMAPILLPRVNALLPQCHTCQNFSSAYLILPLYKQAPRKYFKIILKWKPVRASQSLNPKKWEHNKLRIQKINHSEHNQHLKKRNPYMKLYKLIYYQLWRKHIDVVERHIAYTCWRKDTKRIN